MIFYAFVGYPIVLWLISLFKDTSNKYLKQPGQLDQHQPKVSLLISAYNEENVIEDKLLNSLALNYPKNLLEIVVISDGSDDGTNEIASSYADRGVLLRSYEGRIGKTACLNKAVPLAEGDIIVFSDANSTYNKDAVNELVKHFVDENIGFVTGCTRYISEAGDKTLDSIGVYSKIESHTKTLESKIGSCVGADGAIFAIRKHLYQPLKDFDINDFVIPLNVIKQGFRGVMEENAYCTEKTAGDSKGEFNRQIRITNRTLRAIFNNLDLLNPFKFGLFSFELLSHKICRFLVPLFMLIFFFTNVTLIANKYSYFLLFMGQLSFYLMARFKHSGYEFKALSRLVSVSYTFTLMNIAILLGWIKYFQGETYTTWSPSGR